MTNITEEHKRFFNDLREWNNLCLFSCFVNGVPNAAICAVRREQGTVEIHPVVVFVTDDMVITDHDGTPASAEMDSEA